MKKLCFLISLMSFVSLYAEFTTISGFVVNQKDTPLMFANVYLSNEEGSEVYAGTKADKNGHFVLNTSLRGTYYLITKYIGCKKKVVKIDLNGKSIEVKKIQLEYGPQRKSGCILSCSGIIRKKNAPEPLFQMTYQRVENKTIYLESTTETTKLELFDLSGQPLKEVVFNEPTLNPAINIDEINSSLLIVKAYNTSNKQSTLKIRLE